jgi:hypothetical protein
MTAERKTAERMHRYPRKWESGGGYSWTQESDGAPVMCHSPVTGSRPAFSTVIELETDPEIRETFGHLPPLETPTAAEQPPFKVGDRVYSSEWKSEAAVHSVEWAENRDGPDGWLIVSATGSPWASSWAADCTLVAPATVADGEESPQLAALRAEVERLTARLAEATTWRPIETAPKDGTVFWASMKVGPHLKPYQDTCEWFASERHEGGGWWVSHAMPCYPTHWLPLPPAPAASNAGGGA